MPLSSSHRAALRAKKALANGDMSFKPRGEKNKAAFQALKKPTQANISASNGVSTVSPPQKRIKTASSHTSDLASLLDFKPEDITDTSDEEEEEKEKDDAMLAKIKAHKEQIKKEKDDAMLAKIKAHKEQIKKREEHMKNELSKQKAPSGPFAVRLPPKTKAD